ncbi:MAG: carboxypeptidase M32 [Hyphomicrobiales bacterium]
MNKAYETLETRFRRLNALGGALAMLSWDRSVMMPSGSAEARSEKMATLSVLVHEMKIAPDMGDLLGEAQDAGGLDEWQLANLRQMRHGWLHSTAVPGELVDKMSRASAASEMVWRSARADNDFARLEKPFSETLGLIREAAAAKAEAFGVKPYDALLDMYDPGRTSTDVDTIFNDLLSFLPGMINEIVEHQSNQTPIDGPKAPFDVAAQEKLGRNIIETIGFDFNTGRLDVSLHPFSGGVPDDSRITTRYAENDFSLSLMGLVHETGHSMYERGLPKAWRTQPAGRACGLTLHESQSLLYEMQAARSPQFVGYITPLLREAFSGDEAVWSEAAILQLYHKVKRSLIRVDADEATYPLHVILRYRLEQAMIAGDLKTKDLPEAWRAAMEELVGVVPDSDANGCMQDIHWPSGSFGYFPTYTLGALTAAQIFATIKDQVPDVLAQIGAGDFSNLNAWLRTNIHEQGSLLSPDELIEKATGAPLSTQAFKAHLKQRYLPN